MKPLSLNTLAEWAGGRLIHGNGERCALSVETDTRSLRPGSLFIALKGERHDGHKFVSDAQKMGAIAAVLERMPDEPLDPSFGVILVPDTLQALQKLAHEYRKTLSTRILAITGSCGKSTTKEMVASILSEAGKTQKNKESYNNHIGVPLTLLSIDPEHQFAVVEIGTNHPGEVEPLVALAEPDFGLITNIGWAHVEAFGDRDEIAKEKGMLLRKLSTSGTAILFMDDERIRKMQPLLQARSVLVGKASEAHYRSSQIRIEGTSVLFELTTPQGKASIEFKLPAPHLVSNALLAAAAAMGMGANLENVRSGLQKFQLPKQRCAIYKRASGWLVDDSYNANPDSMLAALDMLETLPGKGRRVAHLGMMGELGSLSEKLHRMIGRTFAQKGVDLLFAVGADARWLIEEAHASGMKQEMAQWFENHEALISAYQKIAQETDKILIKGSRSQTMEIVTQALLKGDVTCSTI